MKPHSDQYFLWAWKGYGLYTVPTGNTEAVEIRDNKGNPLHSIPYNNLQGECLNRAIEDAKAWINNRIESLKQSQPLMSTEFRLLDLDQIVVSETNNLLRESWEFSTDDLKELTDSIASKGVIQPILVRPNDKDGTIGSQDYLLVCGERRYRASALAGQISIPAYIRNLSDEEAFDMQITENLQRKDVHPMKEAQAYKALMDTNPEKNTVQELAHRFGKSPEYIAQRLSFNNLIDEMKAEFKAGKMLIGHAIQFARLQESDQRECLVHCKPKYGPGVDHYDSIKTVEGYIAQKLIRAIGKAPFNPNDETLIEGVGSCNNCLTRSGTGLLFADIQEKDRCFNQSCFEAKTSAHIINKMDDLRQGNPDMAVVIPSGTSPLSTVKKYMTKNGIKALKEFNDFKDASRTDKGAIRAMVACGPDAGEMIYIKPVERKEETPVTSVKSGAKKETPEHMDELIANEKIRIAKVKADKQREIHAGIVTRAKQLKPYQEPDVVPVIDHEFALMLMAMTTHLHPDAERLVSKMISVLNVESEKKMSKNEVLAEKWAHLPQNLINFIYRQFLLENDIENPDTVAGILFRKAVSGWKGIDIEKLEKEAELGFQKQKTESDAVVNDLLAKKKSLLDKIKNKKPKLQ